MTMAAETSNLSQLSGVAFNPLHRSLFDRVKKGDIDGVVKLVQGSNIDMAHLLDEAKNFSQSPIFSACVIQDH